MRLFLATYTYDANNRVVGVTKPDGSTTTTAYDTKQRITSTVEKTAAGIGDVIEKAAVLVVLGDTLDDVDGFIKDGDVLWSKLCGL